MKFGRRNLGYGRARSLGQRGVDVAAYDAVRAFVRSHEFSAVLNVTPLAVISNRRGVTCTINHAAPYRTWVLCGGEKYGPFNAIDKALDKAAELLGKTGSRGKRAGHQNIGRTWESYRGKRTVVGTFNDTGKWLVQMEGDTSGRLEIFDSAQLESEIAFDAKQLARHLALAPEREARAAANAARKAQEAAEDADEANTWGYGETLSALARGRAIKTLNVTLRFNGRYNRRKDEIYLRVVKEGWRTAQTRSWGRVLQSPDGSFLEQKHLTKTGLDFADYLVAKGQRSRGQRRR